MAAESKGPIMAESKSPVFLLCADGALMRVAPELTSKCHAWEKHDGSSVSVEFTSKLVGDFIDALAVEDTDTLMSVRLYPLAKKFALTNWKEKFIAHKIKAFLLMNREFYATFEHNAFKSGAGVISSIAELYIPELENSGKVDMSLVDRYVSQMSKAPINVQTYESGVKVTQYRTIAVYIRVRTDVISGSSVSMTLFFESKFLEPRDGQALRF